MKIMNRKTAFHWTLTALFAGMAMSFPLHSAAENNAGKVNAYKGSVDVRRDPFWPVGHKPVQEQHKATTDQSPGSNGKAGDIDWDEARKKVVINGVSSRSDNEYIAIINNEVRSVGEEVHLEFKGRSYTWKVENITPSGSVKLRRHAVKVGKHITERK